MRTLVLVLAVAGCNKPSNADNQPPGAPVVAVGPDGARTGDDLVASITTESADPDGDAVTYRWSWTRDGADAGISASIVASADTTRGEVWTATATPSDGTDDGAPGSASITIANSPPTVEVLLAPPVVYTDDLLAADAHITDADGDPTTPAYAWTVDGAPAGDGAALDGRTAFSAGQTVGVTVTASDGTDVGTGSQSTIVANSGPSAPFVTITPSSPADADALVCAGASTDADADAITYSYAWDRDGTAYGGTTTDAPGDTVPADATTPGDHWTCTVSAFDGTDTATGTATVTIAGDGGGDGTWYYTCGDPVCRGYSGPFAGVPLCSTEIPGDPCADLGATCDPMNDCNALVTCATEDPAVDCPKSRRKWKHDVRYLTPADEDALARDALSMRLATWAYNDDPLEKQRLGFIIDDAPPSYAVDGDHVDVYGYASLLLATVRAQEKRLSDQEARIDAQQKEIEALRKEIRAGR